MTSIFDTQTVPIANNPDSALPWWRRWRDLERLEYALVRDFFFLTPTLNNEQQISLRRRQLDYLGWGAFYWMITLLICAAALAVLGEKQSVPKFLAWFIALIASSVIPYVLLVRQLIRLPRNVSDRTLTRTHFLWCGWLTLLAFVWFSAFWTLRPQPPADGAFHVAKQIFVYLTIIGQVFVVMFLAASRRAIFSPIVLGVLVPLIFVTPELIKAQQDNGFQNPQVNIFVFFYGQFLIWLLLGLVASLTHKRLLARAILAETAANLAESEHRRANTFVAAISHDVKQPLTALALKLGTLRRKLDNDSPLLPDVLQLQQQTKALGSMIEASFDLSRLHAGTWKVKVREVPLPHVINKAVEELQPMARDKGVCLQTGLVPQCLIWTDPDALDRILQNLIQNAIKYTPAASAKGEPGRVRVECEENGDSICISVSDNGIGIPVNRHKDIFEEYVQVGNPERDREKGFGLGLSIVNHLARMLKHKVDVVSSEGAGSRFSIVVRHVACIPPELVMKAIGKGPDDEQPNLTGATVLLVEDHTPSREALYETLIDWGCYVIEADSRDEAVRKLKNDDDLPKPNFILSDYRLRQGSGLDAIAAIRNELNSAVPAAIWSAESSPDVLQRIALAGVEMLSKPVDEHVLLEVLKRHTAKAVASAADG